MGYQLLASEIVVVHAVKYSVDRIDWTFIVPPFFSWRLLPFCDRRAPVRQKYTGKESGVHSPDLRNAIRNTSAICTARRGVHCSICSRQL